MDILLSRPDRFVKTLHSIGADMTFIFTVFTRLDSRRKTETTACDFSPRGPANNREMAGNIFPILTFRRHGARLDGNDNSGKT